MFLLLALLHLDIGEIEAFEQVHELFPDELPLLFPVLEEVIVHLDVALASYSSRTSARYSAKLLFRTLDAWTACA
jgi:putative effector of murein hydrolase LrgA (UPF0299 family)